MFGCGQGRSPRPRCVHSWFSLVEKTKPIYAGLNQFKLLCERNLWYLTCLRDTKKQSQLLIRGMAAFVNKRANARDWSRTSTTRRSLAPQASASAYSATRAISIYCLLSSPLLREFSIIDYWRLIVNSQFWYRKNSLPAITNSSKKASSGRITKKIEQNQDISKKLGFFIFIPNFYWLSLLLC